MIPHKNSETISDNSIASSPPQRTKANKEDDEDDDDDDEEEEENFATATAIASTPTPTPTVPDPSSRKRKRSTNPSESPSPAENNTKMMKTTTPSPSPSLTNKNHQSTTPTTTQTQSPPYQLRLEAIFHPKFENEQITTQTIRHQMSDNVRLKRGYLEVSLKHSGSLLLYSGGMRYYSKNSTGNNYTDVGEILLRQYMARVWRGDGLNGTTKTTTTDTNTATDTTDEKKEEKMYHALSNHLQNHHLTLSFEVVTAVLSHHGSIPNHDYLVLLSIADRSSSSGAGRFYSTEELVEFAQRWRLPHNDTWTFRTLRGVDELWRLYDGVREDGLCDGVVDGLCRAVDVDDEGGGEGGGGGGRGWIRSPVPHGLYQGNILEGIVIRYVPYDRQGGESSHRKKSMELASRSREIKESVPLPQRQDDKNVADDEARQQSVLEVDLRKVLQSANNDDDQFRIAIQQILNSSSTHPRRKTTILNTNTTTTTHENDSSPLLFLRNGIDNIDKDLLIAEVPIDDGTKKIAVLIRTIRELQIPVSYKLIREETTQSTMDGDDNNAVQKVRYICVVHIHKDSAFQRYHEEILDKEGRMALYRGFSFEIVMCDDDNIGEGVGSIPHEEEEESHAMEDITTTEDTKPLMLKMKFLPYMIRTFILRNGLSYLPHNKNDIGGPQAFYSYSQNQFHRWGISTMAIEKWMPFVRGWASYCSSRWQQRRNGDGGEEEDGDHAGKRLALPPLTAKWYLHHYHHFRKLYDDGKIQKEAHDQPSSSSPPSFLGIVLLVGVHRQELIPLAHTMASELGCTSPSSYVITDDFKERLTANRMLGALDSRSGSASSGGFIATLTIGDKDRNMHRLIQRFAKSITIVTVGCADEDEIDAALMDVVEDEMDGVGRKKIKGMMKQWRKLASPGAGGGGRNGSGGGGGDGVTLVEISRSVLSSLGDGDGDDDDREDPVDGIVHSKQKHIHPDLSSALELIRSKSSIFQRRHRPGLLIYFPLIPGSGKSTICSSITTSTFDKQAGEEEETSNDASQHSRRETIVRHGDSVKSKYYTVVQQEKQEDPSSIYICDKNVPPTSWRSIRDIGRDCRSTMVPVLPDRSAFCTTYVTLSPPLTEEEMDHGGSSNNEVLETTTTTAVYPYSLHYLAVCMLRVLRRKAKTHAGKLDSGVPTACLIVAKFYCFYKNYTSERLLEHLTGTSHQEEEEEEDKRYVTVPFFNRHPLPALPLPLSQSLHEALSLHHATDGAPSSSSSIDNKAHAKALANVCEKRLRTVLMEHSSFLDDLVVGVDDSRMAFLTQVDERVRGLGDGFDGELREMGAKEEIGTCCVQLVSIDIDCKTVWNVLRAIVVKKNNKESISELPRFLFNLPPENSDDGCTNNNTGNEAPQTTTTTTTKNNVGSSSSPSLPSSPSSSSKVGDRYIHKTHVTMAHASQLTQSEIHSRFDSFIGSKVKIRASSLLYNNQVAALEVKIDDNEKGSALPRPVNDFVHVTVWCKNGVVAKEANELVKGLGKEKKEEREGGDGTGGGVTRIVLEEPVVLDGVVAFWHGI